MANKFMNDIKRNKKLIKISLILNAINIIGIILIVLL